MVDGIPLGGARRVVAEPDRDAVFLDQPLGQGVLPQMGATAVASSGIAQDQ